MTTNCEECTREHEILQCEECSCSFSKRRELWLHIKEEHMDEDYDLEGGTKKLNFIDPEDYKDCSPIDKLRVIYDVMDERQDLLLECELWRYRHYKLKKKLEKIENKDVKKPRGKKTK